MPKSKISCLPSTIQDELNERLSQNDDFQATLAWLNELPTEQVAALQATGASRMPADPATPKADGGLKKEDGQNQAQAEQREDPTRPEAGGQLRWIEQK